MLRWLSRCLPGISTLLLVLLLAFAFGNVEWYHPLPPHRCPGRCQHNRHGVGLDPLPLKLKPSQAIFIFYSVFVHLDTLLFALRLCLSILLVENRTKATIRRRHELPTSGSYADSDMECARHTMGSPLLQTCPEAVGLKPDDLLQATEVIHAIIIPNYGEDIDTLRTTLAVLASHPRAETQYEVYLAMELKETNSASKAAFLISSFQNRFLEVRATFHPNNLPGEIAGKSSNVAFAAREMFKHHRLDENRGNIIITVIDSDTHLLQDYFTEIRRLHHKPDSSRALYVCPIIFDRNAHETPLLVRVADILWGGAGLAGYLPWAPIHIPTSVYSLPLGLAESVGGWDGDPTAIGEDMHMLLKAYFNSHGSLVTVPVYSPASQCNISSTRPRGCFRTFDTLRARYSQALRHMWGSLDTGYAVRRMVQMEWFRLSHLSLCHLLWEAHMLPLHFILILVASALYTLVVPSRHIHPLLHWTFWLMAVLRNASFVVMQVAFSLYDSYHALCVSTRAKDMEKTHITEMFAYRNPIHWKYLAERVLFPIVGILYSAVPALHAQVCHFWTDRKSVV